MSRKRHSTPRRKEYEQLLHELQVELVKLQRWGDGSDAPLDG
jgi:polyphosphate kinase 2 (PPK2 family)